jgi:hypothetical protein
VGGTRRAVNEEPNTGLGGPRDYTYQQCVWCTQYVGDSLHPSSSINGVNGICREGETKTVLAAIISRMMPTSMNVLPMMAALAMLNLHPAFKQRIIFLWVVRLLTCEGIRYNDFFQRPCVRLFDHPRRIRSTSFDVSPITSCCAS